MSSLVLISLYAVMFGTLALYIYNRAQESQERSPPPPTGSTYRIKTGRGSSRKTGDWDKELDLDVETLKSYRGKQ